MSAPYLDVAVAAGASGRFNAARRIIDGSAIGVVVDELAENGVRLLVFPTVRPDDF